MSPVNSRRIGILGGSFDPVHNGHLAVAQTAYEHLRLDTVYFIPAAIPPHKSMSVSQSPKHRLAMLKRAVKGNPAFRIWDGEIRRGGISFTLDTIVAFRRRFPGAEFFFIIGSDNIREMLSWRNYTTIIRQVTLCVVHRPGYSLRVPYELADAAIVRAPSPEWGISSTLVRSLRAGNSTCRYLVPDPVLEYMDRYGLYQDAP